MGEGRARGGGGEGKITQWFSHKNMSTTQTENYFENPLVMFLEEPMLFLLALKWNLQEKQCSYVNPLTTNVPQHDWFLFDGEHWSSMG